MSCDARYATATPLFVFLCHHPNLSWPQDGTFGFRSGQDVIFESLATFTDNVMGVSDTTANASFTALALEGNTACRVHASARDDLRKKRERFSVVMARLSRCGAT